jgi:hypothetical protein
MKSRPSALRTLAALAIAGCSSFYAIPLVLLAAPLVGCAGRQPADETARSAAMVAADLLATDRALAIFAQDRDLVTALSTVFAADVVMSAPGGHMATGVAEVAETLRASPNESDARMTWTPIRAGISADGLHGFTYGYGTLIRPSGERVPLKYLSYWIRTADGWRISAYRRALATKAAPAQAVLPPILPLRMVAVGAPDAAARYAAEIDKAERTFSGDAQTGLAAAFRRFGAPESMNMGGPDDAAFRFGPDSIAAGVGDAAPGTTITWEPTTVRAATSGDLGVSIGFITIGSAAANSEASPPRRIPFFTVWHRSSTQDPWRYIAE